MHAEILMVQTSKQMHFDTNQYLVPHWALPCGSLTNLPTYIATV
jgi:hypothetical protein